MEKSCFDTVVSRGEGLECSKKFLEEGGGRLWQKFEQGLSRFYGVIVTLWTPNPAIRVQVSVELLFFISCKTHFIYYRSYVYTEKNYFDTVVSRKEG